MKKKGTSDLSGFRKLSLADRFTEITSRLKHSGLREGLGFEQADEMIENAIGVFGMPLGVATNFVVNGVDVLVPMAIEEPSVVAAASNAAKMVRDSGGFTAIPPRPITVAQVEILEPKEGAKENLESAAAEIAEMANSTQPELVTLGGGLELVEVRENAGKGRLVVHLHVDCRDAMGANMVNTMAENVSGLIAELAGGRQGLRILTNLADTRVAFASCEVSFAALTRRGFRGEEVAKGIVSATDFADADSYRAATHNKGIFNGIDSFLIACGNDWRAVEAGGHAYAVKKGRYGPLARWALTPSGIRGELKMPMAVGIVGGAARAHPTARACIELAGLETAADLACVASSLGLASNLAALAALCSEGIQAGHMKLHVRRVRKR